MRPDFSKIEFEPVAVRNSAPPGQEWLTLEHIAVKGAYTAEDLAGLAALPGRALRTQQLLS